jgi:hypothetical protein
MLNLKPDFISVLSVNILNFWCRVYCFIKIIVNK